MRLAFGPHGSCVGLSWLLIWFCPGCVQAVLICFCVHTVLGASPAPASQIGTKAIRPCRALSLLPSQCAERLHCRPISGVMAPESRPVLCAVRAASMCAAAEQPVLAAGPERRLHRPVGLLVGQFGDRRINNCV